MYLYFYTQYTVIVALASALTASTAFRKRPSEHKLKIQALELNIQADDIR